MAYHHNPRVVTNGLVLYLDAANRKSYSGSGTDWNDLSGNNYSGSLTNGPTFDSGNGGSIVFDGLDDYTLLSNNVGVSNLSAFSISFWAKKSNSSSVSTVYSEGLPANWPSDLFIIYFGSSENGGKCRVWYGNNTRLISTTNVTDNKWYYVTYNQTNTSNRVLYINGIVEATNSATITHIGTNTYIGANNNNGTFTQYGKQNLANLMCYSRALSSEEILQNYNALKGRFGL